MEIIPSSEKGQALQVSQPFFRFSVSINSDPFVLQASIQKQLAHHAWSAEDDTVMA
jgi:hypothetical protein